MKAWACLVLLAVSLPAHARSVRITVLHTNDIHGWIMPRAAGTYGADPGRPIGGAAALAAYVKKVRGPKLLLDSGDWFQGTPEGTIRAGGSVVDVFNAVGYDALTVGNHEFDNGLPALQGLVQAARAPVVCSNVYGADGARSSLFQPGIIKEVGGVKVGIFGLLTGNMKNLSFPDNIAGLTFRRGVDEAKDAVAALRAQGATVVIALSHQGLEPPGAAGLEGDRFLAEHVAGIDLIVGGHTHTALKQGARDPVHGTLIVQAGTELLRVGVVGLEVDSRTGRVVKSSARLADLWPDQTGSDPALAKVVAGLNREVSAAYDVVLATAGAALTRNRDGESALGDWMTDCERRWAGADLAVQNGGSIRADIPAGPVTLRRLFEVMPFDNRVVKLVMKGKDVRSVLDHGVGLARMAQISGAEVSYRRRAPEGRRLTQAKVAGRELVDESTYTVATVDFLVKGGDDFTAFAAAQSADFTKTMLRDLLRDCALERPSIQPPPASRLVPAGD
ncbi:MAG: bifunctional UDP-sugar hydrolase/5'-nucleotidase [Elusimicrobia bacterium]|nr:bifunctional UDP-sugar hydrolase/5'-nucleotidase [Elusimicrobiota bacterium]